MRCGKLGRQRSRLPRPRRVSVHGCSGLAEKIGREEEEMPVHKRKRKGRVDWYFKFDLQGATRTTRRIIRAFGFATRQEAVDAEANRRIDEQKKAELAKAGAGVDAPVPKTLATLLDEFI